jgi:glycosyltransferase involved in cell wall biosynthesis
MRILHVITTLDVGGAEMHLLSQVRGQAARGHEVELAYLKGFGTLAEDFRAAGARWVGCVGTGLGLPSALWSRMRRADIVHSHLLKADMVCATLAACTGRARVLVSGKHNDEQVLKRPLVSLVHGVLGRVPRRTVVLSDHVGRFIERYGRVPRSKLTRVYYGLDAEAFARAARLEAGQRAALRAQFGWSERELVFTCVARFAPQKAHDVLLRAFAHARTQPGGADLRLLLVGDDPFGDGRKRAEALARELELGPSVCFAGIRRDVPHVLAASDVFVLASLWEGLGLVFLEAMALGMPVLATQVSAVPEVVEPESTGVLVPAGDARALADGMLRLAADAGLRERLGAAGARRVRERFGLERMVEDTLAVYADVHANGTRKHAAR